MVHRVVNVGEQIGRVVGRRKPGDPLRVKPFGAKAQRWREAFGGFMTRRGVYRFRSFEEAQSWKTKVLIPPKS